MTKIDSNIDKDELTLILPNSVSSNILDFLIEETLKKYRYNNNAIHNIFIDLSKIKYIDLEGTLSIICFCSAIKRKNINTNFHLIYPEKNILNYLITLGFFGQMSNKVGIIEGQEIIRYENELRKKRRLKQEINSNILKPIILPIETINQQMDSISGKDFENMVGDFVNDVIDSFNTILSSPHYNFNGKDQHDFLLSNIELYKNIFEHSKSWGIASIHARPNYGTTVCYYDIGIGFKASIARFNSESESIEWALIDGNSSKPDGDNDGFGLTIVQNFVLRRNGKLKIRSGDCIYKINSTSKQKDKVNKFSGVQISYFIPV